VDKETIAKSLDASHALILPAHCVLHPHALGYLGHAIDTRPDTQLLYTDSDHLHQGAHVEPLFKPDFDPVLLEQVNYIGSAVVLDRCLLINVLAKPADMLGGQFLSQIAFCDKEVIHIKKVLVGERKMPPNRRYPADFYKKIAFDNAFCENHTAPFVSVIIPTRDQLVLLQQAVSSILQLTTYSYYEIIIVDNDSQDRATRDYLEIMSERENIQVIAFSGEFNYSAINNQAVAVARGEYLCLLNNDVKVITPHWLEAMLGYAQRPSIGCVGAKLYYANDTVQHAGVVLSPDTIAQHAFAYASKHDAGYMGLLNVTHCVSAVTGACLMVAKSIYLSVDGLNAADLKVAYNDIDFCLKVMRAGYRNVFTPEAELYHFESISRGIAETPEEKSQYSHERAYMLLRWREQLAQDPYYNTNFSTVGYSYCLPFIAV
jgi:GT2 family glycosyltransferase